ncbi:MAG: SPOR domain-containing protein [Pseudomonadota bacterium]
MDQNIKNRLVGVIVVFALAVIFLPMILDGSGVRKDKLEVVIPPPPTVSENSEFEPKLIELKEDVDALPELDARFIDEDVTQSKAEPKVIEETDTGPEIEKVETPAVEAEKKSAEKVETSPKAGGDSWVLQVGSFQDRNKALIQRDRIRKSNIAAVFIEQFDIDDQSNYRVRLGPFLNRDQTRVAQNKIKAKHDIDGIIMKYER